MAARQVLLPDILLVRIVLVGIVVHVIFIWSREALQEAVLASPSHVDERSTKVLLGWVHAEHLIGAELPRRE
jgi:uncharacterized membrane protein YqiK